MVYRSLPAFTVAISVAGVADGFEIDAVFALAVLFAILVFCETGEHPERNTTAPADAIKPFIFNIYYDPPINSEHLNPFRASGQFFRRMDGIAEYYLRRPEATC